MDKNTLVATLILIASLLTAYYITREAFVVFLGEGHYHEEPHEVETRNELSNAYTKLFIPYGWVFALELFLLYE
jgi:NADH dehydrogenase subunit L (EC 1.6.5.3)